MRGLTIKGDSSSWLGNHNREASYSHWRFEKYEEPRLFLLFLFMNNDTQTILTHMWYSYTRGTIGKLKPSLLFGRYEGSNMDWPYQWLKRATGCQVCSCKAFTILIRNSMRTEKQKNFGHLWSWLILECILHHWGHIIHVVITCDQTYGRIVTIWSRVPKMYLLLSVSSVSETWSSGTLQTLN